MKGVLLDIDGTTLLGPDPLPGAQALVAYLRGEGIPLLWLTNNTSRSRAGWLARLAAAGLAPRDDEVYTAGDATIDHVRAASPPPRVFLVGTRELCGDFERAGLALCGADEDPEVVVLGYDTELTYEKLRQTALLLQRGLPYLATHPDATCPTPDGPVPDVGSFIALLEVATGRRPTVIGKPERAMVDGVLGRLGARPEDVVLVGDRLATDIHMANAAGIPSLLVLTGVTREADLPSPLAVPSAVWPSLVEVLADLRARCGPPDRGPPGDGLARGVSER